MSDLHDPLQKLFRSQSATPESGHNARRKYDEYLKKLEKRNQVSRASNREQRDRDELLKQRENGFQLYVNGVHHTPPPRSSSAMRKRVETSVHHTQAPSRINPNCAFTNACSGNRRQWLPPSQATIKTEQGSLITDVHAHRIKSNHAPSGRGQLTYRVDSPASVDRSWMPDWFTNSKSTEEAPDSASAADNLRPSISPSQQTYRLSSPVGARLAGGDLTKNTSTHATNQALFATGPRRTSKTVDSLDLENFAHPKEVHIDEESEEKKPSQAASSSNRRNPFGDAASNDRQNEWLEKSMTQIDLFSRRHRGMLENERIDEYFSSGASRPDHENDEEHFTIPELPVGEQLVFNLKTTWGDRHYVGLNGIELFSGEGHPILIKKITADPPDINILPEYGNDPRVVANLVDGVNKTRDDIHMWLAPFSSGRPHWIYITFEHPTKIAMIRIWNYNKSRIHSARGAKDVDISLDGHIIFKGEITQACGNINASNDPSAYGETILFTTEDRILEKISTYDEMYIDQEAAEEDEDNPKTGTNRPPSPGTDVRPMTRAMLRRPFTALRSSASSQVPEYYGKKLILTVTETWGDPDYCGLTGLEVVDINDADCVIASYDARPRDMTVLQNHAGDVRTLDKLFDSENVTCDGSHMWLCPFSRADRVRIIINLSVSKKLHGLRVWNYNQSPDDTYRGIKRLHVQLNDKIISPRQGFLLRRAPGHCYFDFAQEVVFAHAKTMLPDSQKQNKPMARATTDSDISMPNGFIFEFQLHSTHGDAYYIGLNGIEFYDDNGERIGLIQQNIAAYPHSINALNPGNDDDVRTPDKLIDGENDDIDGSHSWIAPILPSVINRVFVIFDRPTSVSMIKIWNYAKTPNRGVREFSLLVDDLLVWTGILDKMSETAVSKAQVPFNTILFSDERILTEHEKQTVLENKNSSDSVATPPSSRDQDVDYSKRPTTSVPRAQRRPPNK